MKSQQSPDSTNGSKILHSNLGHFLECGAFSVPGSDNVFGFTDT